MIKILNIQDKTGYELMHGRYDVLAELQDNCTNGDMIKAMFPNVEVKERNNGYEVYFGVGTAIQFFNHQWWNAPYKAESVGGKNGSI